MFSKKYIQDYRVEYTLSKRGKIRAAARYAGDWYRVLPGAAAARALGRELSALCAAMGLILCALIRWESGSARQLYAMMPRVLALFPMLFLSISAVRLLRTKEIMTRQDGERRVQSPRKDSFLAALCFGLALAGEIIYLIASGGKNLAMELPPLFLTSCALCCALWCFALAGRLRAEALPKGDGSGETGNEGIVR